MGARAQAKQKYSLMSLKAKRMMEDRLEDFAPEFDLGGICYPSFQVKHEPSPTSSTMLS